MDADGKSHEPLGVERSDALRHPDRWLTDGPVDRAANLATAWQLHHSCPSGSCCCTCTFGRLGQLRGAARDASTTARAPGTASACAITCAPSTDNPHHTKDPH